MSIFITDRNQSNVDRRNALAKKGWAHMTAAEQAEWTGNPLLVEGANLLPYGTNYGSGTSVKHTDKSITVTSNWDGSYIYAILVVGAAADFEGKTLTLSLDSFYSTGGIPNAALYWHDGNGYEFAGGGLTNVGSTTFALTANAQKRANLALYLYATTEAAITAGSYIRYEGLMLEMGSVRHAYAPYFPTVPTMATKGAYNFTDLNRVESAVAALSDELNLGLTTKTNWAMWDIPKKADMTRFLSNIRAIRKAAALITGAPAAPSSMDKFTYTSANDIEKILEYAETVLAAFIRCGDIYCGEVG